MIQRWNSAGMHQSDHSKMNLQFFWIIDSVGAIWRLYCSWWLERCLYTILMRPISGGVSKKMHSNFQHLDFNEIAYSSIKELNPNEKHRADIILLSSLTNQWRQLPLCNSIVRLLPSHYNPNERYCCILKWYFWDEIIAN